VFFFVSPFLRSLWLFPADAYKALLALSLTNTLFLSSARRQIYYTPSRSSALYRRSSTFELLATLRHNSYLALLVRDLDDLTTLPSIVESLSGSPAAALQWQVEMLETCLHVEQVRLDFVEQTAPKTVARMAPVLESLKTLELDFLRQAGCSFVNFKCWTSAHQNLNHAAHPRLILHITDKCDRCNSSDSHSRISYTVKDLSIVLSSESVVDFAKSFLPLPSSHLPSMRINAGHLDWYRNLSSWVPELAGNHLRRFVFQGSTLLPEDLEDQEYSDLDRAQMELPPALFGSFPSAESVEIRWTSQMTAEKLALLADSSPHLTNLDLAGTIWSYRYPDFVANMNGGPSRAEAELIAVLKQMPSLKHLDVGMLPVSGWEDHPTRLIEYCSSRDLSLRWKSIEVLGSSSDEDNRSSEESVEEAWTSDAGGWSEEE
jgi:hypothetical protein